MVYTEYELLSESGHGHVSNVTLFDYLDQARKEWYYFCRMHDVSAVVVHVSMDFKKEIFDKEKLYIKTVMNRVGNTSFTLTQTIVNQQKELVAQAEVVLATIDRETRMKVSVPDELRTLLNNNEVLDYKHSVTANK
ncbi:thioesterase family protein [Bacillus sp. V5-8f]|uniref:acyl-CoA thioesterase n=1 Tax=Bacillus sp. V5-8f TaxID=2053044 RepID=UPI000C767506|nr:hotdog domain-containing protein [Bacillus sp. V5-8f]PLT35611.1 acyl-CoA thioesterase [Bacillus sp. V5-8f]